LSRPASAAPLALLLLAISCDSTTGPAPTATPTPSATHATVKGQFDIRIEGHQDIGAAFNGSLDLNLPASGAADACHRIASKGAGDGTLHLPTVRAESGAKFGLVVAGSISGYAGPGSYGSDHFSGTSSISVTNLSVKDIEAELKPPATQMSASVASDGSGRLTIAGRNAMNTAQSVSGFIEWTCSNSSA
jgi:hypothetical protein